MIPVRGVGGDPLAGLRRRRGQNELATFGKNIWKLAPPLLFLGFEGAAVFCYTELP
jgi:hypothetical protein